MEFTYTALNKEGQSKSDSVDATSYRDAITLLHNQGLIPVELKEKKTKWTEFDLLSSLSTVSLEDKILFVQNLSIVLKAGVPLTKGLKILVVQTKNAKFRNVLQAVYLDVEQGKTLSESLEKYPKIFPNIFVSMVRVGEASGNLDKSLEYLAIQLQREHDLVSKTKGAMIYPAVIVFTIIVVGILMSIFVLPKLVGIFKESNIELPLTTKMVIAFTDFMSGHPVLVLGGFVALIAGFIAAYRTEKGARVFDKTLLLMPIFGEIAKKINMARFCRIMSSMLKSGTPILEGLQITSTSLSNVQYRDALGKVVQDVKIGKTLGGALAQYPGLFSYLVTQMIDVGEESGTVDQILEELAVHFEIEVDDTMRNLSSVIEPVLLLVIGGVVGVLAMALISPIYSLTQQGG